MPEHLEHFGIPCILPECEEWECEICRFLQPKGEFIKCRCGRIVCEDCRSDEPDEEYAGKCIYCQKEDDDE